MAEVGQGSHTTGRRGQRVAYAPCVCVPALWLLLPPPSGFFGLLAKYNFLVFFWNFLIFRNMVS
jgi:hypothetical protein